MARFCSCTRSFRPSSSFNTIGECGGGEDTTVGGGWGARRGVGAATGMVTGGGGGGCGSTRVRPESHESAPSVEGPSENLHTTHPHPVNGPPRQERGVGASKPAGALTSLKRRSLAAQLPAAPRAYSSAGSRPAGRARRERERATEARGSGRQRRATALATRRGRQSRRRRRSLLLPSAPASSCS